MKKYLLVFVIFLIYSYQSLNSTINRLDLGNSIEIVNSVINNPDSLIHYLMLNESKQELGLEKTTGLSAKWIEILKKEFDGEYRFTYCDLDWYLPNCINSDKLPSNVSNFNRLILQINSLKSGRVLTVRLFYSSGKWTLKYIDPFDPSGMPDPDIEEKRKPYFSDLPKNDNCLPYIEENYSQIRDLLKKSDSLYLLKKSLFSNEASNNEIYKSKEQFNIYYEGFSKDFFVERDEIFEANDELKKDGITLLNKITLATENKKFIVFYFMKKQGNWKFYDKELANTTFLPKYMLE